MGYPYTDICDVLYHMSDKTTNTKGHENDGLIKKNERSSKVTKRSKVKCENDNKMNTENQH